jgi:hypothetical protein
MQNRARAIVLGAIVAAVALQVALLASFSFWPLLRDPDYGNRIVRLHALVRESPQRPLLVILGSSRTALGLRPDVLMEVWSRNGGAANVFNFSRIGNGPLFELLYLHRLLARGIRPDWLVVELWPLFLDDSSLDGREDERLDVNWLESADWAVLARHSALHDELLRRWQRERLTPWYSNRSILMQYFAPSWGKFDPFGYQLSSTLDRWGWLDAKAMNRERYRREAKPMTERYGKTLARFEPSARADGEIREILDLCRGHRIPASLLFMPETSDLRATYGPRSRQRLAAYVGKLAIDYAIPVIDTSDWSPDDDFGDADHLTAEGALEFSRRFAERAGPPAKGRALALRTEVASDGVRIAEHR